MRLTHSPLLAAGLFAVLVSISTASAYACGGCFSPPTPTIQQTVVQNAERILFVRNELTKVSTVWVEVRYTGLATEFGWVLPVPKLPKVGVGSAVVFDALDSQFSAFYQQTFLANENCRNPSEGCEPQQYNGQPVAMDAAASGGWADAASSDGGAHYDPTVQILASGQTGPYNYLVVQGSEAKPLLDWLNANGYATPQKALPIIDSHIKKGDKFVAIKLQNGQGIEAIRPVVLEMDDAEPCVPLRLTSIAAAEDMAVIVTVAGPGRAIVKNHLDVEVNPLRLNLGAGTVPNNYAQVMSAAIDEAGGHAFVTESSLPPPANKALAPQLQNFQPKYLAQMKTMLALAKFLLNGDLPLTDDIATALNKILQLEKTWPGISPLQMLANLKACAQYWQMPISPACNLQGLVLNQNDLEAMPIDGVALADAVTTDVVGPINEVAKLLGGQKRVTRLVMRVSPEEMDRDPVFAFHASLPQVARARTYASNSVCPNGWSNEVYRQRISIDGLGSWVFDFTIAKDSRFANAPAALRMRLLDENVDPIDIDVSDISLVDTAIMGALPGKPSLPAGMTLKTVKAWLPPPSDPLVTKQTPWKKPGSWCTPKPGWVDGQMAPKPGTVYKADAGATDGGTNVPGIDAAGGWVDVPQDKQPAATNAKTDGCTAGRTSGTGLGLLLLLGLAGWLIRRRIA